MRKQKRPTGIFISYRHDDSKHAAARIFRRFRRRFGRKVFWDTEGLEVGKNFAIAINKRLSSCQAALIIIGPKWLSIEDDEGSPRLENPKDWVRREVETALAREPEIKCIPVLVDGARLPKSHELPESIKELSLRHAFIIPDDPLFDDGVNRLIEKFNPRIPWPRVIGLGALIIVAMFGVAWAINFEPGTSAVMSAGPVLSAGPVPEPIVMNPAPAPPRIGETHQNSLGMRFKPIAGSNVLVSAFETKLGEYRRFAAETGRNIEFPVFGKAPGATQEYRQSTNEPATMVDWNEANAFCEWLTKVEESDGWLAGHQHYRLPTDEEWSLAVGLSSEPDGMPAYKSGNPESEIFPWEDGKWPPPDNAGNYGGQESKSVASPKVVNETFNDGYPFTSTVGAFPGNKFGIHDLGGNVWEWCSSIVDYDSKNHVLRGGSWNNVTRNKMTSTFRNEDPPEAKFNNVGFRCVIDFAKPGSPTQLP